MRDIEKVCRAIQGEIVGDPVEVALLLAARLACVVRNARRIRRRGDFEAPTEFEGPHWSKVAGLTGYGSTFAAMICRAAGADPETGELS